MNKKLAESLLRQWAREDPPRLLQSALQQGRRIDELRAENAFLREQLEAKNKRIGELESALEEAMRAAHRQAAPFRIREQKRMGAPKRPGRKKGHPGCFRPKPERVDEEISVELSLCPHCGGTQFTDQSEIEQMIEDIPPIAPKITRLRTYAATCVSCGEEVRSNHPLQMSLATGAAGVQLGPHALAIATDLNKAKGLSMRKTCAVLADCFGLHLSAGGLSQALTRIAGKLQPRYEGLALQLRHAQVVHSDEPSGSEIAKGRSLCPKGGAGGRRQTSWWVGGAGWWPWVFTKHILFIRTYMLDARRATILQKSGGTSVQIVKFIHMPSTLAWLAVEAAPDRTRLAVHGPTRSCGLPLAADFNQRRIALSGKFHSNRPARLFTKVPLAG